ncbi:hypothetical protein J6590_001566 [Homalodisca vitripennis]|nr:hypothetical protein J6590_001566 [Homalodisca vitripennis]
MKGCGQMKSESRSGIGNAPKGEELHQAGPGNERSEHSTERETEEYCEIPPLLPPLPRQHHPHSTLASPSFD